jgi:hypothetical protein
MKVFDYVLLFFVVLFVVLALAMGLVLIAGLA